MENLNCQTMNNFNLNINQDPNYKEVSDYVLTRILGKGTFGVVYSG